MIAVMLFLLSGSVAFSTTVYWRSEASSGDWDSGLGCEPVGTPASPWWYDGWTDNESRGRPDCYGNHVITFGNNAWLTMTLNNGWCAANQIIFQSSASSARTIGSAGIDMNDSGAKIENNSSATHVFNCDISFHVAGEINPVAGALTFSGAIYNNGNTISVYGDNSKMLTLSGNLQHAGGLTLQQNSKVKISGASTYTGNTTINKGEFWMASGGSLPAANAIYLGNGSAVSDYCKIWLESDGIRLTNTVTVNAGNIGTRLMGGLNTSGTNYFCGPITLNGPVYLEANNSAGTVAFTNVISGANALFKSGAGTVILSGVNTHTGTNTVLEGVLKVGADRNLGATPSGIMTNQIIMTNWATLQATASFTLDANRGITLDGPGTLSVDSGQTLTYSGVIADSGADGKALTKKGAGTLTLGGANIFRGNLYVDAGRVTVTNADPFDMSYLDLCALSGSDSAALFLSNGVSIDNKVTVRFGSSGSAMIGAEAAGAASIVGDVQIDKPLIVSNVSGNTLTFQNIFQTNDELCVIKRGAGTMVLYTNSFRHLTNEAGTVSIGCSGGWSNDWTHIALASGSTWNLNGFTGVVACVEGAGNVNIGSGVMQVMDGWDATLSGVVSGSGRVVKKGSGRLTLSGNSGAYSGSVEIHEGIIRAAHAYGLGGTATGTSVSNGGALEVSGGITMAEPLTLNGGGVSSGGALRNISSDNTLNGAITLATASRINSDSGTLTLGATADISGTDLGLTVGGAGNVLIWGDLPTGAATLTKDGSGTLQLNNMSATRTWTGATTISAGTLQLTAANGISDASAVTVDSGATFNLAAGNDTVGSIAGAGSIVLGNSTLTAGGDNSDTTFGGVISGSGGVLTKVGTGTLILSGNNTYGGVTYVSNSHLRISHTNALGSVSGRTEIANDGTLDLLGGLTIAPEPVTLKGVGYYGGGTLRNISGDNTFCGQITLGAASRINSDSGTLTLTNASGLVGAYGVTFGGNGDIAASTPINTGANTVTKDGAGMLTLSGSSGYTGATALNGGVIRVAHQYGLGWHATGTTVADGAALQVIGGITVNEPLTLNGSGFYAVNGALRNISGDNTLNGAITLATASRINSDSGTLTLGADADISGAGIGLTVGGAGTVNIWGDLPTGAATLTKDGSGTLLLNNFSATRTWTGATTISAGTLQLTAANGISDASALTVASGATFNMSAGNDTVGSIAGAGSIVLGNSTLTAGGDDTSTLFSGAISGVGGVVTKTGTGALTFSGASTYSGNTTVNAGSLIMNGTNTSSAVSVSSGAFLLGVGAVKGLTVTGQVGPGTNTIGIGRLSVTSLTMNNGSSFRCQLGDFTDTTDRDCITNSGAATISASVTIYVDSSELSNWNYTQPKSWNIIVGGIDAGDAANCTLDQTTYWTEETYPKNGGVFSLSASGNNLVLSFEPIYPVWDGGGVDGNWDTAANWDGDIVPGSSTNVIFYSSHTSGTNINLNGSRTVLGLQFNDDADDALNITNSTLTINESGIAISTGAAGNHVISADIVLNADQTWTNESTTADLMVNGVISGPGTLSKMGNADGRIILAGDNTFTNTVTVTQGRVLITHANALGAVAAGTTVASGPGLQIQGDITTAAEPLTLNGDGYNGGGALENVSGSNTFSGPITLAGNTRITSDTGSLILNSAAAISGSGYNLEFAGSGTNMVTGAIAIGTGTLTKSDAGTLILTAANTYSGNTTVSAGTLIMNGTNTSSDVTVGSGAYLLGVGAVKGLTVSGQLGPGTNTIGIGCLEVTSLTLNDASSFRCQLGDFTDTTDRDCITNSGTATISASATIYVDSSKLSNWDNTKETNWTIIAGGIDADDATNCILDQTTYWDGVTHPLGSGTFSLSAADNNLVLSFSQNAVVLPVWDGGGADGNWDTAENWDGDTVPDSATNAVFYTGVASGTNINLNGNRTVLGLRFNDNADDALNITNSTLTINEGGIAISTGAAGNHVISAGIVLNANQSWTNESTTADLTVNGVVSGSGALVKAGNAPSRIILAGNNTFTNTLTITQGRILMTHSNALGSSGGGAAPNLVPDPGFEDMATYWTINNASLARALAGAGESGTTALSITNAGEGNWVDSRKFASPAAGQVCKFTARAKYTGTIAGNVYLRIYQYNSAGGELEVTVSTNIQSSLTTDWATYSLECTINAQCVTNKIRLENYSGNGTAQILFDNVCFNQTNSTEVSYGRTIVQSGPGLQIQGDITTAAEPLTLNGNGYYGGGALENVSGNNTFSGPITLAGNTRIRSTTGSLTLNSATAISGSGYNLEIAGGGITLVSSAIATGAGGVTKSDTGTLILNGANTHSGNTTVSTGTLIMNGTNTSSDVSVSSGAYLLGVGSVKGLTVSGQVGPGTNTIGIGKLDVTSLTLNNGASFRCQLGDVSGTTDRDYINNAGSAEIAATATIYLDSSKVSNWDNTKTNSWDIIVGGIDATDVSHLTLDQTTYWDTNACPFGIGGTFSLDTSDDNLVLTFNPPALPVWDGGGADGNWDTVENWDGDVMPASSTNVIFYDAIGSGTNINLNGNRTMKGIEFNDNADTALNITNSILTINGGGITVSTGVAARHVISAGIVLGANQTWTHGPEEYDLAIDGIVSGFGTLTKAGNLGRIVLSGNNTFSNTFTVSEGKVLITHSNALGAIVKPGETAENLLANPGFETNGVGWTKYGGATECGFAAYAAESGNYGAWITNVSSPNIYQFIPAATWSPDIGKTFVFRIRAKKEGTIDEKVFMQIYHPYAADVQTNLTSVLTEEWQTFEVFYTPSAAADQDLKIILANYGGAAGNGHVFFDNAFFGLTNGTAASSAGTTIEWGSALQIQGDIITAAEPLTLDGDGWWDSGALDNVSGNNTFSGPITLTGHSHICAHNGSLTLNSSTAISGSGYNLKFSGSNGNVLVSSAINTGTGGVTRFDAGGSLTLSGTSGYTGPTMLEMGTLVVLGDIHTSSSLITYTNTFLKGNGSIPALTLAGQVEPGNGTSNTVGTLTAAAVTISAKSKYIVDFDGAVDGTAGEDWDLIETGSGTITVNATSDDPCTVELHDHGMTGWDATQSYDFPIIQGGSVVSFDADKFTLDYTDWPELHKGTLSLLASGGDLILHFEPTPTPTDCYVTNAGPESMAVMWTPPYATTDVLVVRRQGADPEVPVDGIAYTNLQRYGSGDTTMVIYFGTNTSVQDMELFADTSYAYAMYAAYGSGASVLYSDIGTIKADGVLTNTTSTFLEFGLPLESFAYFPTDAIGTQNGGTNWVGGWVKDWGHASIVAGSMLMPENAVPAYGNRIRLDPPDIIPAEYNTMLHRSFEGIDSGVIYLQFALNTSTNNGSRYALLILCDTNSGDAVEKIAFGVPGKTNVLGIQRHWIDGETTNWSTAHSDFVVDPGQDYLCMAKIDFTQHKAWIAGYANTGILPSQEPSEYRWGTSLDFPSDWFTNLNLVRLSVGAYDSESADAIYFDEIRMGHYWTNQIAATGTTTNWAIWDGGAAAYTSELYSVDLNWENDARPETEATLLFTGSQNLFPTNDYGTAAQWNSIWFTNTSASFTLRGDDAYIRTKIENQTAVKQTVDQVITFNGNYTGRVNAVHGDLVMNKTVWLETNLMLFVGGGGGHIVTFNGPIRNGAGSTTSGVHLADNTIAIYSNANTYEGRTYLAAGELRLGADNCIYDDGNVELATGAVFNLNGYHEKVGRVSALGDIQLGSGTLQIEGDVAGAGISGVISGSGSLVYVGSGGSYPLALTASNTYEGGTTVSGTWITVWTDRNLGAVPSSPMENLKIANNSAIRFTNSMTLHPNRTLNIESSNLGSGGALFVSPDMTLDYAGEITGYGKLSAKGGGILNLYGNNSFTGIVEVQYGTLAIGADANLGAVPDSVASNKLAIGWVLGDDWQTVLFTNSFELNAKRGLLLRKHGILEVVDGKDLVYNGKITEDNVGKALSKRGLGTLILGGANTFMGNLYIDAGTVTVTNADPFSMDYLDIGATNGSAWSALYLRDGVTIDNKITVRYGSSGTALIGSDVPGASAVIADVQIDKPLIVSNVTGNVLAFRKIYQTNDELAVIKRGVGTMVLMTNSFRHLTNEAGVVRLACHDGWYDWTHIDQSAGASWDLNGFTGLVACVEGAGSVDLSTGGVLYVASGWARTLSGVLSGTGNVIKAGTDEWTLSAANTYEGKTYIQGGGTLIVSQESNLGAVPSDTVADSLNIGDWSAWKVNTGFTMDARRGITIHQGEGGRIDVADGQTLVYDGVIAGVLKSFTKTGLGTLQLGGINTFSSNFWIDAGTAVLSSGGDLASSLITLGYYEGTAAAMLSLANGANLDVPLSVRAGSSGAKTLNVIGGTAQVSAGYLYLNADLAVTLGGNLTITPDINMSANASSHDLNITGAGNLTLGRIVAQDGNCDLNYNGSGTLTLSGDSATDVANQMKLNIGGGVVSISSKNNLGDDPGGAYSDKINFLTSDGTLLATETLSLDSGTYDWGITIGLVEATFSVADTKTMTIPGVLYGAGSVKKAGAGTLVLSGTSTYAGSSTLSAGILVVNGDISDSSGLTVPVGTTLEGIGTVPATTLEGIVGPGDGSANDIGTLAVDAITLSTGGTYRVDFGNVSGSAGSGWDLIAAGSITVSATLGDPFTIELHDDNISNWNPDSNYVWTVVSGSSISGFNTNVFTLNTADWPETAGFFSIENSGNNLNLRYTTTNLPCATECYVTNNQGSEAMYVSWLRPEPYNVLVVRRQGDWPDAPVNGTAYDVLDTYGTDGRNRVIYLGTASEVYDFELLPETGYYYAFYVENYSYYSECSGTVKGAGYAKNATTPPYPVGTIVEPFSYFEDQDLNTKNGGNEWTNAWSGTGYRFFAAALSFSEMTGYPTPHGNKMAFTPANDTGYSLTRYFNTRNYGKIYLAYMMNYSFSGAGKWLGVALMSNDTEKVFAGEISSQDQQLGLSVGGSETGSSYTLTAGSGYDYLVIMAYDFSTRELKTKAYYKTDTVPGDEPGSWDASVTLSAGYMNSVNGIKVTGGAASGTPGNCYIDEFRMAASWNDLVEHATYVWDAGAYPDRDWSSVANWEGNKEPTASANALIGGSYTGEISQVGEEVYSLTIGNENPGTLLMGGGSLTAVDRILLGQGNYGALWATNAALLCGENLELAVSDGATGVVHLITSSVVIGSSLNVGGQGNTVAYLRLDGSDVTVTQAIDAGDQVSSEVIVEMDNGSSLNQQIDSYPINVGTMGRGYLYTSNGTVINAAGNARIGGKAGGTQGAFGLMKIDGSTNTFGKSVAVAEYTGTTGEVVLVSGGRLNVTSEGLNVGLSGVGLLSLNDAETYLYNSGLTVGNDAGATGRVALANGAYLYTGDGMTIGWGGVGFLGATNSTVDLDGGFTVADQSGSAGVIYLDTGASLISSNGFTVGNQLGTEGNLFLDHASYLEMQNGDQSVLVGFQGQGNMMLSNSATANFSGNMFIGGVDWPGSEPFDVDCPGAFGSVTLNASTATVASMVQVGSYPQATGELYVANGGLLSVQANGLDIGKFGDGLLEVSGGGQAHVYSGGIRIAQAAGSTGRIGVTDQGELHVYDEELIVAQAAGSTGRVWVTDQGLVQVHNRTLRVGMQGDGGMSVSNASLMVDQQIVVGHGEGAVGFLHADAEARLSVGDTLFLGLDSGSLGRFWMDHGSSMELPSNGAPQVVGFGGRGELCLSNSSVLNMQGNLLVAGPIWEDHPAAYGMVRIHASTTTVQGSDFPSSIANGTDSTGEVYVAAGGRLVVNSGNFTVGSVGNGLLDVRNGEVHTYNNNINVGDQSGSTGVVWLANQGLLDVHDGSLTIGREGYGHVHVSNAVLNAANGITLAEGSGSEGWLHYYVATSTVSGGVNIGAASGGLAGLILDAQSLWQQVDPNRPTSFVGSWGQGWLVLSNNSAFYSDGGLQIGGNNGDDSSAGSQGTLVIDDSEMSLGQEVRLSCYSDSIGTIRLDAGGSLSITNGDVPVIIGFKGEGGMTCSNGATFEMYGNIYLGGVDWWNEEEERFSENCSGAYGYWQLNASTATVSKTIQVGSYPYATGAVYLANGSVLNLQSENILIGQFGVGTVGIRGSEFHLNSAGFSLGNEAGSTGTAWLDDQGWLELSDGSMWIGRYGNGELSASNGSLIEISSDQDLGGQDGIKGCLYLNASTNRMNNLRIAETAGSTGLVVLTANAGLETGGQIDLGLGGQGAIYATNSTISCGNYLAFGDAAGSGVLHMDHSVLTIADHLNMGCQQYSTGLMTLDNTSSVTIANEMYLPNNIDATSVLTLDHDSTLTQENGDSRIFLGLSNGYGELTCSNGVNVNIAGSFFIGGPDWEEHPGAYGRWILNASTATIGRTTYVGGSSHATGAVYMANNAVLNVNGFAAVGQMGNGILNVDDASTLTLNDEFRIAEGSGSTGRLYVDHGSTLSSTKAEMRVVFGTQGDGLLSLSNGSTFSAAATLSMGGADWVAESTGAKAVCMMNASTGTLGGGATIGWYPGNTGTLQLANNSYLASANGDFIVGESGDGYLDVSNSTMQVAGGAFLIDVNSQGTGRAKLYNSSLQVGGWVVVGQGSGFGELYADSSSVIDMNDEFRIGESSGSRGRIYLDHGTVLNQNREDLMIVFGLEGDGMLSLSNGAVFNMSAGGMALGGTDWEGVVGDGAKGEVVLNASTGVLNGVSLGMRDNATGLITVANGSMLRTTWAAIGSEGQTKGCGVTVTGSGSIWSNNEMIVLGYSGTLNRIVVDQEALLFSGGGIIVGDQDSSVANYVLISNAYMEGGELDLRHGTNEFSGGTMNLDFLRMNAGSDARFIFNAGTLRVPKTHVENGTRFDVGDGTQSATLAMRGWYGEDTLIFADGLRISTAAELNGSGTIEGNLEVYGTLRPGNTAGCIIVNGNMSLGAASHTYMEINGINQAEDFDYVEVHGDVEAGGTLNISLDPAFEESVGECDEFILLAADSPITGTFDNYSNGDEVMLGTNTFYIHYGAAADCPNRVYLNKSLYSVWSWTGAGFEADWSDKGNWDVESRPYSGPLTRLVFGEESNTSNTNDISDPFDLEGIFFTEGCPAEFILRGGEINLIWLIVNDSSYRQEFKMDVNLASNAIIAPANNEMVFSNVNKGVYDLSVMTPQGDFGLTIEGQLNGSGNVWKSGDGLLMLTGGGDNSGAIVVSNGDLAVFNGGAGTGNISMMSGTLLFGDGSMGAITLSGTVAPGKDDRGTINCPAMTIHDGAAYAFTANAEGADLITVAGALQFADSPSITLDLSDAGGGEFVDGMVIMDYGEGSSAGSPSWTVTGDVPGFDLSSVTVVNDTDNKQWKLTGFSPDCNLTNAVSLSEDSVELFAKAGHPENCDLISVDAFTYSDMLTNQWRFVQDATGSESACYTNLVENLGGKMRFFRTAPKNMWKTDQQYRRAGTNIYVTRMISLTAGQNWVSLPGIPNDCTPKGVFGLNQLPRAASSVSATRILWYDQGARIEPTNTIWLNNSTGWQYLSGASANEMQIPLDQGMVIDIPSNTVSASFLFIGRVRTDYETVAIQGGGAMTMVSLNLPCAMHPSQMNLRESGLLSNFRAQGADWIAKWNRSSTQGSTTWMYYSTRYNKWVYKSNNAEVTGAVFTPDDAMIIQTWTNSPGFIWTNKFPYSVPSDRMTP